MLNADIQWKMAQLKQEELLREASVSWQLELDRDLAKRAFWWGLVQSLGDRMIAAGYWLKGQRSVSRAPVSQECGA